MTLTLAAAQLDFVVGDIAGNAVENLFLRPAFTEASDDAVKGIAIALAEDSRRRTTSWHATCRTMKASTRSNGVRGS
ncbi:hypothetical protein [Variovorax sp. V213]|jgi:hypothetical protein|uniref:hypothetical protein n=1 Tax=Variovorax sp. V213 TaxID=3065955 RepID=UPI0034E89EEE